MKILYVTPLVLGIEDILRGDLDAKGLPSMVLPLKKLLTDGHKVDVIFVSNYKGSYNIHDKTLKKMRIIANINNDLTISKGLKKIVRLCQSGIEEFSTVSKAIRDNSYDVIFCHGTAAVVGNIVANRKHIPCVYRIYGTVGLYHECIKNKGIKAILKNPIYYLIFKLKKYCMIGTDEGSHTDRVYQMWKPRRNPYPFYHWLNGVDIQSIDELRKKFYEIPTEPYLFMAGRVTDVKNQAYAVKMLYGLKKKGISIDLYFAGHIDETYRIRLEEMIEKYGLRDKVHFMGPIPGEYLKVMGYNAKACIICDDYCQNGNVFYEIYSTGGIVVSIDDGSLDRFVEKGKSVFLAKNISDAVECLKKAIDMSDEERNRMRRLAIKRSQEILSTWETRVEKEIHILESACLK